MGKKFDTTSGESDAFKHEQIDFVCSYGPGAASLVVSLFRRRLWLVVPRRQRVPKVGVALSIEAPE